MAIWSSAYISENKKKQVELSSAKLSSLSWVELSLAEAELEFDLVWWLKYLKSSKLKLVKLVYIH